jgi:hypothetical protein
MLIHLFTYRIERRTNPRLEEVLRGYHTTRPHALCLLVETNSCYKIYIAYNFDQLKFMPKSFSRPAVGRKNPYRPPPWVAEQAKEMPRFYIALTKKGLLATCDYLVPSTFSNLRDLSTSFFQLQSCFRHLCNTSPPSPKCHS